MTILVDGVEGNIYIFWKLKGRLKIQTSDESGSKASVRYTSLTREVMMFGLITLKTPLFTVKISRARSDKLRNQNFLRDHIFSCVKQLIHFKIDIQISICKKWHFGLPHFNVVNYSSDIFVSSSWIVFGGASRSVFSDFSFNFELFTKDWPLYRILKVKFWVWGCIIFWKEGDGQKPTAWKNSEFIRLHFPVFRSRLYCEYLQRNNQEFKV